MEARTNLISAQESRSVTGRSLRDRSVGGQRRTCLALAACIVSALLLAGSSAWAETNEVKRLRAAAEAGEARAQYKLGRLYADGDGVCQSYRKAARWYGKAAEQGHVLAQNKLGVLYERGLGVGQDLIEAYKWFTLAAGRGSNATVCGVVNREALARRLTSEQMHQARRRAAPLLAKTSPTVPAD